MQINGRRVTDGTSQTVKVILLAAAASFGAFVLAAVSRKRFRQWDAAVAVEQHVFSEKAGTAGRATRADDCAAEDSNSAGVEDCEYSLPSTALLGQESVENHGYALPRHAHLARRVGEDHCALPHTVLTCT